MYPKRNEPIGIFATRMLWFMAKCLKPNNSEVIETANEVIAPADMPMIAVPENRQNFDGLSRRKKEIAIGTIRRAREAVLDTAHFRLPLD